MSHLGHYNLYTISEEELEYIQQYREYANKIGYAHSEHHPDLYKPYGSYVPQEAEKPKRQYKTTEANAKIPGRFYARDFKYFCRPHHLWTKKDNVWTKRVLDEAM